MGWEPLEHRRVSHICGPQKGGPGWLQPCLLRPWDSPRTPHPQGPQTSLQWLHSWSLCVFTCLCVYAGAGAHVCTPAGQILTSDVSISHSRLIFLRKGLFLIWNSTCWNSTEPASLGASKPGDPQVFPSPIWGGHMREPTHPAFIWALGHRTQVVMPTEPSTDLSHGKFLSPTWGRSYG